MTCAQPPDGGTGRGVRLEALRLPCLLLALALYGLVSSPTPAAPGAVEAAIGMLLVAAAGPSHGLAVLAGFALRWPVLAPHESIGVPVFAVLLWVPLLRGLTAGWELRDVMRDVIPLLYFALPLFLARLIGSGGERLLPWLAAAVMTVGVLFAWRYFRIAHVPIGRVRLAVPSDHLLYLPNSPSVLFAAVALPLIALKQVERPTLARLGAAALLLGGGLICLAALAATLQRAALGLAVLGLGAGLLGRCRERPILVLLLPVAAGVLLWLSWERISGLAGLLLLKTQLVGLNRHDSEIAVALDAAGESLAQALFGAGWGALIETPAVPGIAVSYLHALPLYFLVKTGFLGSAATLAWLIGLLPGLRALWRRDPSLCLAVLPPLTVSTLFQPSFKSLDFGLLLTLLAAASQQARAMARAVAGTDRE